MKDILKQVPWKSVIAILLTGVLISGGILVYRQMTKPELPKYTVVFKGSQGAVLAQQQVTAGGSAIPPKLQQDNDAIVFRGWSKHLYNIQKDTEVTPVYEDLRQAANAFYMDAAYALPGDEMEMTLWLGGSVRLSGIELTLSYDKDVLQNFRCDVEGSLFQIVATGEDSVTLRLDATDNLTETTAAATVRFTVSKDREDIARTSILVDMADPVLTVSGTQVGTGSSAVHGDIYILS